MISQTVYMPKRVGFISSPTPLYRLSGVSADFGCDIFVKRDDLAGIGFGGNKLRKLDYLIADALKKGCSAIVTNGSLQTNHGMLTALCATKAGLRCLLFLLIEDAGKKTLSGNLLLDDYIGCDIELVDVSDIMASKRSVEEKDLLCEARLRLRKEEVLPHYLNKYETQRDALYEIPSAGSTPTGIMGYFSCMREISDQTESPFDYIFCGNGSGGTYAGLWLGSKFLQTGSRIIGVNIEEMNPKKPAFIANLINSAAENLGLSVKAQPEDFCFLTNSVNLGYGIPDDDTMSVIEYMARKEGFFLDPVYSAKVFNGALKFIRQNRLPRNSRILLLHSGGLPGIFNENMIEYRNQRSGILDRWNHAAD